MHHRATLGYPTADALVEGFLAGDEAALRVAYERFAPLVFRLATAVLQSPSRAENTTVATFVTAWSMRSTLDANRQPFADWLMQLAKRNIVDDLRRPPSNSPTDETSAAARQ